MNLWAHWEFIVTAIIAPLCYWIGSLRKERKNDLKEFIDYLTKEREVLKEEIRELRREIEVYRKKEKETEKLLNENITEIAELRRQFKEIQK